MKRSNRAEIYRDLIELWVAWWNGPGRQYYVGQVLPPLTKTSDALVCLICKGIKDDAGRCEACLRDVSMELYDG